MIDPRTVLVAVPCYAGTNVTELTGSLIQCNGLYAAFSGPTECSHVSLARNLIAGSFMASDFEWLVCIDHDHAFTRRDFELLMQPVDMLADQQPTRLMLPQFASGVPVNFNTDVKRPAPADLIVCSEYSFKNDTLEPIKLGLGFTRIHRSVFDRLQNLVHDGGPTIEVQRHHFEALKKMRDEFRELNDVDYPRCMVEDLLDTADDKAGQPRLWQVSHKGRMYYDYYPSGPILSQFVPSAEWKGEDHGFFTLCMLAGIIPRIETRTRIVHFGRKGYPYLGPDAGGGQ